MKRVAVIGAGVGGITTAARLAQQGYQVTVFEKNDVPGGRCGRIEIEGHRFDTGATLFLMPSQYAEAFHSLGERMEDHLELARVDPTYHLHFGDGTSLSLTSDQEAMRDQLENIEKGSYHGFLQFLREGARHYNLAAPRFLARDCRTISGFFNPINLFTLARIGLITSHHDHLGQFFRDERLRTAFGFQNLYVGLSPYAAPAVFSLIQHLEFADGIWFPKGGMHSVVDAFVSIAMHAGVRFVYNTPVSRINIEDDRATGVTFNDGTVFHADMVVANADLTYVYRELLPAGREANRLEHKKYGTSAITFLWGLDRSYPELAAHNLFFSPNIRDSYTALFDGRGLPTSPHFYVYAPARIDPTMAPPGEDTLMVAIPCGHLDERFPKNWDEVRTRARETVLSRLEASGLHDLRKHIKIEITRTPVDWQRSYNLTKGSTHGLSHNLTQMAYLRPHNRHAHYRNIYFVGASTHPGTGIPNVLLSAAFATKRIIEDEEAKARPALDDLIAPPPPIGLMTGTLATPRTV